VAVVAECYVRGVSTRRYMGAEGLAKARLRVIDGDLEEVTAHALSEVM